MLLQRENDPMVVTKYIIPSLKVSACMKSDMSLLHIRVTQESKSPELLFTVHL